MTIKAHHSPWTIDRRCLLQAGAMGVAGLTAGNLYKARAESSLSAPGFGRAKQCLLLFMWGGPSQIETFDPKPEAPTEVRGEFGQIATNVPSIHFSEYFTRIARQAEKLAVVRSLTHDDPAHLSSAHTALTGHLPPVNKSDAEPPSDRDTPHIGAVMSHLRPALAQLPSAVTMPWLVYHPAAPGGRAPGQHAGWLGHQHDPLLVTGDPSKPGWEVPALALVQGQSPERLASRRELLNSLARQRSALEAGSALGELMPHQRQAFDLLTSPAVRSAFSLQQETDETRQRYGRNIHGQCVLLARRLIDHGVPLVSVNWHDDGRNFWDTHGNNFQRLKDDLIPPSDQALSALLEDLSASGKLSETLVVWVGEFGRAPRVNTSAGRDHHPGCYSGLLAGGGIRGGQVFGRSDRHAALPADLPVSPHDLVATIYHALGIPPNTLLSDVLGRPHSLYAGSPLTSLFG